MAKRETIYDEPVPQTWEERERRLGVLCDRLYKAREEGVLTPAQDRVWSRLLDFWDYADPSNDHALPKTDPVTLLDTAKTARLMTAEQVDGLKAEFMRKASGIAGRDLSPKQVKKLYSLFRNFNPAQP